jgi:hypothetical protein
MTDPVSKVTRGRPQKPTNMMGFSIAPVAKRRNHFWVAGILEINVTKSKDLERDSDSKIVSTAPFPVETPLTMNVARTYKKKMG